jgi:hypothetical protein
MEVASVAQWTEHRSSEPSVAGSNPARGVCSICGHDVMAAYLLAMQEVRVRFPVSA